MQRAAISTKSDAQSICELPSPSTCRSNTAAGDNGVRNAPSAIYSKRWRSIAYPALYFGCVPSKKVGFGRRTLSFGHHSHSFRPKMAGAHCLRYQPPDRLSRGEANIEADVAAPDNASASATEREAFAKLQPSNQLPDLKKREPKRKRQHTIAKRRAPRLHSWQRGKCNLAGLATACGERLDGSYRPFETMSLTLSIGHAGCG